MPQEAGYAIVRSEKQGGRIHKVWDGKMQSVTYEIYPTKAEAEFVRDLAYPGSDVKPVTITT